MKKLILPIAIIASILLTISIKPRAQEAGKGSQTAAPRSAEYASIRFMEERTSIVWPDGTVEKVMDLVPKKKFDGGEKYPKESDYRMYWLTMGMNVAAQKGYELTHMNDRDVIMVRRFNSK
jgi:hypothetical protein